MSVEVLADSLVTLNYRVSNLEGVEFIGTFDAAPAVLKLGNDELAPALERCLVGMRVDERKVFELPAAEGFGPHMDHLVQRIPRDRLPDGDKLVAHTLLEFDAPNGARFTGLILETDSQTALIDFNHPLAGKPVRFEAQIIGVI